MGDRCLSLALLSSFAFALYHQNVIQAIYAFVQGMLFCLFYDWSRDLGSTFLLHMVINLVAYKGTGTIWMTYLLHHPTGRIATWLVSIPLMVFCYRRFIELCKTSQDDNDHIEPKAEFIEDFEEDIYG